jgi:peptide/nickel transport system substrate-binding protein
MKPTLTLGGLCVAAAVLTGCSGDGTKASSAGGGDVVDGGTFTMAMSGDPGNLDPQGSAVSALFQISKFAYDPLLSVDATSGDIKSGLASAWKAAGKTITLTLNSGITCSDGSAFTATDAAANVNYVADPKNKSPFLGTYLPAGAKATGDDTTRTVTITLAGPAPFALNGLGSLSMVCATGMKDRASLRSHTAGTGPYQLTEAVPSDHYTFRIRPGYTWGPAGAATDTPGLPDTVIVKIVQNETTSANLLLSGGLNAAQITGPDADRLAKAGLFISPTTGLLGEMWFNHAAARPTADPNVRRALAQALDLEQLRKVLTSGKGSAPTTFATIAPVACPGKLPAGALPAHDVAKAGQLLDQAGWQKDPDGVRTKNGAKLALTFVHDTSLGPGGTAAAELAAQQWKDLGVAVTNRAQTTAVTSDTLFSTGNWDIGWVPLNVSSPDQLVPFMSGPAAPNGTNFAGINNAEYQAAVAKATTMDGASGCPTWLAAEAHLVADVDVIPFANNVVNTFGKKARFATAGYILPTSIRMLGH